MARPSLHTLKRYWCRSYPLEASSFWTILPSYSPDLNPIEMAFSKLKAHLRRIGAHTFTDLFNAIAEICDLYSPDECWNYFKAAGYVAS
tara:strand:- start:2704 stop:2970 length:267 start_codon:yes stop_codon:yes gene_type:complete